ncbi:LacI family DNA-binding transcriptional regulator [Demequina sp. SO4-13]|uniref:LacI family DNA-binding transcriptional regulator n=1 Tax=Demequina sp. SO4-13 TaxID=3401027 RepID=UPI003AF65979
MAQDKPARAANIFDVARLAGVSHQTVSRVINGMPNVRPATKERVEQAMKQLRYSPSPAARALVTRRTRTIGLITSGSVDYGPSSIAMHFNRAARDSRYSVDTVSTGERDPETAKRAVEGLLRQRVDALVMVVNDAEVLEMVRGLDVGVPLVVAASTARRGPQLVSIDQYRGARAAVRHLAERGHTRILHLAGPEQSTDAIERLRGWRDELAARRLDASAVPHGDWTAESGYVIGTDMEISRGSSVFVGNDQMAIGLMSALRRRGLSVPEDVSLVGFDDLPEAAYLDPPLTTVRQDFVALGQMMMQKVLVSLEEGTDESADTPLPTKLMVRESTRDVSHDEP